MSIYGQTSCTLSTITDVKSIYTYHCLISGTYAPGMAPTDNISPLDSNNQVKDTIVITYNSNTYTWTLVEPNLDITNIDLNKLYYIDCTIFSNNTYDWGPALVSSSYEAAKQAYNKADIASGLVGDMNQHFWWLTSAYSTGVPAGAYVTNDSKDDFKTNPSNKSNLLLQSAGISLRHGTDTKAQLTTNGLKISQGGIEAGTSNTNNYVYISSENGPRIAINGYTPPDPTAQATLNAPQWREIIGTKFGVLSDGTLYANEAHINGAITATSLTINSNATINDTSGLISNSAVQVGGRNLLYNSGTMPAVSSGDKGWRASGGTVSHIDISTPPIAGVSGGIRCTNTNSSMTRVGIAQDLLANRFIAGKKYSMGCWIRASAEFSSVVSIQPIWISNSQTTNSKPISMTLNTNWQYISAEGLALAGDQASSYSAGYVYASNVPAGGYIEVCGIMLEEGTKCTSWTPAPEDVASDIDDASKVANSFLKFESGENGGLMVADLNGASDTTIHGIDTRNVLIDPNSVDIREGQNILASFGETTVIGENTEGHSRVFIDPNSDESGITNIFRVVSKNNIDAHQIILDDNNLSNNVPVVIETPYWTDGIGSYSDPLTTTPRTSTPATFVIDEMDEIPNGQEFKVDVLLTTYKHSGKLSYGHPESCVIPFTKGSSETINWGLDTFSGTVLYTVKMEYTAPKTFKLTVTAELASTTSGVRYWLSISEICALYHTQQELVPIHKMHGDVYLNSGGLGRTFIGLESIINSSVGQAVYGNDVDFHNALLSYNWIHGRINDFDLKELLYDLICTTPIGTIEMYAGLTLPTGWLYCNGQAISRSTYSVLFEAIGTSFGEGDGSTTFNLPDLRGRFPLGIGTGTAADATAHTLNQKGGREKVTLGAANMPYHRHGIPKLSMSTYDGFKPSLQVCSVTTGGSSTSDNPILYANESRGTANKNNAYTGASNVGGMHTHTTNANNTDYAGGSSGAATAHENMPPYIGLRFIIYTGLNRKE